MNVIVYIPRHDDDGPPSNIGGAIGFGFFVVGLVVMVVIVIRHIMRRQR